MATRGGETGRTVATKRQGDASSSRVVRNVVPQSALDAVRLAITGQVRLRNKWVDIPPDMAAAMAHPGEFAVSGSEYVGNAISPALAASLSGSPAALCTKLSPVEGLKVDSLSRLAMDVATSMDPRLQLAIMNARTGKQGLPISSASGDQVAVIARVTSYQEWKDIPDVDPGADIGPSTDGGSLVTGRIPIREAETIRQNPAVLSLKASQPVEPTLARTLPSMGIPALDPAVTGSGAGVVIGIVDGGGDFAHQNFLRKNGKTRLLALWQQGASATAGSPYGYGRLHTAADIDKALKKADPYAALGYDPGFGTPTSPGSHGTHVMDIAAGNGRGSGFPGVASEADIVFVEMSAKDIAWAGQQAVYNNFGDSVQMLEAVKFIFETAGDRPCVVNLSLGTNGGPHDGSSLVEQGLDALVMEKPNRAVVLAAGNSQRDDVHTMGTVPANASIEVEFENVNGMGGEFELWYPGAGRLRAELVGPDGTTLATVAPGENFPLGAGGGQVAAFLSSRLTDPNNKDNVIGIWLAPGWPDGPVKVRLAELVGADITFHAWLERQDRGQAYFKAPVKSHLLGSLSTGRKSIVVGAYDASKTAEPAASFSSAGPTRDGREKPELSAPGFQVQAAQSRTSTGLVKKSGTSMAAPAVTGLVALMLAKARKGGQSLNADQIRAKLKGGLKPGVGAAAWDSQLGDGRASGSSV